MFFKRYPKFSPSSNERVAPHVFLVVERESAIGSTDAKKLLRDLSLGLAATSLNREYRGSVSCFLCSCTLTTAVPISGGTVSFNMSRCLTCVCLRHLVIMQN